MPSVRRNYGAPLKIAQLLTPRGPAHLKLHSFSQRLRPLRPQRILMEVGQALMFRRSCAVKGMSVRYSLHTSPTPSPQTAPVNPDGGV